ncbi:MAG: hypothetical protein WC626_13955 [Methanoregula sp.]
MCGTAITGSTGITLPPDADKVPGLLCLARLVIIPYLYRLPLSL